MRLPILAAALVALPTLAAAQGAPLIRYFDDQAGLFSTLDADGQAGVAQLRADPSVLNLRLAEVDALAAIGAETLSLGLPQQLNGVAETQFSGLSVEPTGDGYVLSGTGTGENQVMTVAMVGDVVFGSIRRGSELYRMQTVRPGVTAVYRYDTSRLEDHAEDAGPRLEAASAARPAAPMREAGGPKRLDVMVYVTPGAMDEMGGFVQSLAMMRVAESESNAILKLSGVDASLRILMTMPVTYRSTGTFRTDMDRILDKTDGHLDFVPTFSRMLAADATVVVTRRIATATGSACGEANVINAADADEALVMVAQNCATGYYSFLHEIGHLVGAYHNPEQVSTPNPHFSYAHGTCQGPWRSMMAYNTGRACADRLGILSSGRPIKVIGISVTTGDTRERDNARLFRERWPVLAAFRSGATGSDVQAGAAAAPASAASPAPAADNGTGSALGGGGMQAITFE